MENLFRNYDLTVRRNIEIYNTLKDVHEIYTGKKERNWDTYTEWGKNGVTYGDMRKGVWVIASGHVRPLAAS